MRLIVGGMSGQIIIDVLGQVGGGFCKKPIVVISRQGPIIMCNQSRVRKVIDNQSCEVGGASIL